LLGRSVAFGITAVVLCLVVVVGVIAFSGYVFDYTLSAYTGLNCSFGIDCIAGLVLSEIVWPAAVIALVVHGCGVEYPFFNLNSN